MLLRFSREIWSKCTYCRTEKSLRYAVAWVYRYLCVELEKQAGLLTDLLRECRRCVKDAHDQNRIIEDTHAD